MYTTLPFLLASIGPIVPFVLIGLIARRKTYAPIERLGALVIIGCYTAFLFPHIVQWFGITNVRILFPAMYIFLGWFAAAGLASIKKQWIQTLLIILFLLIEAPTFLWEIKIKIPVITGYYYYFTLKSTYDAYLFLGKTPPYTDVVLANPYSQSDVRVPALSGHQTVSGHMLTTIRSEEKDTMAKEFFGLTMKKELVIPWMNQQRITYVLLTSLDGNKTVFETRYPFLTPLYTTSTATVYTLQNK